MKRILFTLILMATLLASCDKPEGPLSSFTPGQLWLDNNGVHINAHGGGFLFKDGRYWWFGEHKVEGDAGNRAQVGVRCYSSKDLYNWRDEGIALAVVEDDTLSPIAKGAIIERPKVIYNEKSGKYVMWFHLELKGQGYSAAQCGVAVSDNVAGPYKFVRNGRVNPGVWASNAMPFHKTDNNGEHDESFSGSTASKHCDSLNLHGRDFGGGQMSRDMTLFVDDDGKAYHIYSSEENSTTHIAELTDDYTAHSGKYIRAFVNRYMEAPAICKRNGKYYFIGSGCTGWAPNMARSAVADNIMGEWTELESPCIGENSEITFGGQSTYIIPVDGKRDAYIFVADIWRPENAIDGRYMFLPMTFEGDQIRLKWSDQWDMNFFDNKK